MLECKDDAKRKEWTKNKMKMDVMVAGRIVAGKEGGRRLFWVTDFRVFVV